MNVAFNPIGNRGSFQQALKQASRAGFTLVELMVVVAIIGILAAIAGPQYQKFQAKSRQTEAKVALGGLFTAERAYQSESGSHSLCLEDIGYKPESGNRYYAVGWSSVTSSVCGPSGTLACALTYPAGSSTGTACTGTSNGYPGTAKVGSASASSVAISSLGSAMTSSTFTATALGNISTASVLDRWTIDETKSLINVSSGL